MKKGKTKDSKAWMQVISSKYPPEFISVNILDKTKTNLTLVSKQDSNKSNSQVDNNEQNSFFVSDQKLCPKSNINELNNLVDIQFCNPPQITRYLKQDQLNKDWLKIGNNFIVDRDPLRKQTKLTDIQRADLCKFYQYHLQSLLSNKQQFKRFITLVGNIPYSHQYIYPLLTQLNSNSQLWPYRFNIQKLQLIIERLLGGVYIQMKLGYLMKNYRCRQTQYIHIKSYLPSVPSSLWIPRYLLDLINNQNCFQNYLAPKPTSQNTSQKQTNQIVSSLLGIGVSVLQINNLMKMLSCIANLRGISIIEQQAGSEDQLYYVYRLIDSKLQSDKANKNKQTSEYVDRFCTLSRINPQIFKNIVLYGNSSHIPNKLDQDLLNSAKYRLRVLEYIFYEKFIEYLCFVLNNKLCSNKAVQNIYNTITSSNTKQKEQKQSKNKQINTHKTLIIFSMLSQKDQYQRLIHPDLQRFQNSNQANQSLEATLQILSKINFIQHLYPDNNYNQKSKYQNKNVQELIPLKQFMNIQSRTKILKEISNLNGDTWIQQENSNRQKDIRILYQQVREYPVIDEMIQNIIGKKVALPNQIMNIPTTIKQPLWNNIEINKKQFKQMLVNINSNNSMDYYGPQKKYIAKNCQPKYEQAFVMPNSFLLNDYSLIQKLVEKLNFVKNRDSSQQNNNHDISMTLNLFADRYKYTKHCKQRIHQRYSTFLNQGKISKIKKNYTFYEDNLVISDQLTKKVIQFYLNQGFSSYQLRNEESDCKNNKQKINKNQMLVIFTDPQFFISLEQQVQQQNLILKKIRLQYLISKARRQTNKIINRNQRKKRLSKNLLMLILKRKRDSFFLIKACAFCKTIKKIIKISSNQSKLHQGFKRLKVRVATMKIRDIYVKIEKKNKAEAFLRIKTLKKNSSSSPEKNKSASNQKPENISNINKTSKIPQQNTGEKPSEIIQPPTQTNPQNTNIQPPKSPNKSQPIINPQPPKSPSNIQSKSLNNSQPPKSPNNSQPLINTQPPKPPSNIQSKSLNNSQPSNSIQPPKSPNNSQLPANNQSNPLTHHNPLKKSLIEKQQEKNLLNSSQVPKISVNPIPQKPSENPQKSSQLNIQQSQSKILLEQKKNDQFIKKLEGLKQITKPELEKLKDQPNISLELWQKHSLIKKQPPNNPVKAIQMKHKSLNQLETLPAKDLWQIHPDPIIAQKIKKCDYMAFMKNHSNFIPGDVKDFMKVTKFQTSQLDAPILRIFPLKSHPKVFKQTFNTILKIGQHKNTSKTLDVLLNQLIIPISKSYDEYFKNSQNKIYEEEPILPQDYSCPHNIIKDEIFLQISKQLTENKQKKSIIGLLHGLSVITRYYYPSKQLIYWYLNYFEKLHVSSSELMKSSKQSSRAMPSLLQAIIENLLLFIEAIESRKGNKVSAFILPQKSLIRDQDQRLSYLSLRKKPIMSVQMNVGSQKPTKQERKSVTPSKINFSNISNNKTQSLVKSKPLQCVIRLLNNCAFSYYVRNDTVKAIKRKVLIEIGFINKQDCFTLDILTKGYIYELLNDEDKMIDHMFQAQGTEKTIYLRIRYYFPFQLKDQNACRLTYLNLISEEITYPWFSKKYEYLVVQSMITGQFEEIRVNNYINFSNQLESKNPNMNQIKQLYIKESTNISKKIYEFEYMKYLKEARFFMMKCYRIKGDKSFAIGIKPSEIMFFDGETITASISMDRVRNVYRQKDDVILQLMYMETIQGKQLQMVKIYTIKQPFRPDQLFHSIQHQLQNKLEPSFIL